MMARGANLARGETEKRLIMRIKIKSIKISVKWWQLAAIVVLAILALRVPDLIVSLLDGRR